MPGMSSPLLAGPDPEALNRMGDDLLVVVAIIAIIAVAGLFVICTVTRWFK
jgi:hypothetical protein